MKNNKTLTITLIVVGVILSLTAIYFVVENEKKKERERIAKEQMIKQQQEFMNELEELNKIH